jgi:hypothetical protein
MLRGKPEEVAPDPGNLVNSLRDFGYTLPTALADLLDNSLTANAFHIHVIVETEGSNTHIAVIDNGQGMDQNTLVEAMRMGTCGPQFLRQNNDLGRFGLGMKTASLSLGQCLTVISKQEDSDTIARCWDIPYIQNVHRWELLQDLTPVAEQYYEQIKKKTSGTAVIIEKIDRVSFMQLPEVQRNRYASISLELIRKHLAMVFHRFIQEGVKLQLGETLVPPWDPFLCNKSTRLVCERLHFMDNSIGVFPFVLPHHSHLTEKEHEDAGGLHGWNDHQGFYIYRNKRLIVPGSWLNLGFKKEEHFKLARIQVDIPNTMDAEWHLNVMKSHVSVPAYLRDDLLRIGRAARKEAGEVYRFRGERAAPTDAPAERYIWKRTDNQKSVRYRIDITHPVIQSLLHTGCIHETLLRHAIDLIERTVPIATMLQESAKAIEGGVQAEQQLEIEQLVEMFSFTEQFYVRLGKTHKEAREMVLMAEPFCRFQKQLLMRLQLGVSEGKKKEDG